MNIQRRQRCGISSPWRRDVSHPRKNRPKRDHIPVIIVSLQSVLSFSLKKTILEWIQSLIIDINRTLNNSVSGFKSPPPHHHHQRGEYSNAWKCQVKNRNEMLNDPVSGFIFVIARATDPVNKHPSRMFESTGIDWNWMSLYVMLLMTDREHNSFCDKILSLHPSWKTQQIVK